MKTCVQILFNLEKRLRLSWIVKLKGRSTIPQNRLCLLLFQSVVSNPQIWSIPSRQTRKLGLKEISFVAADFGITSGYYNNSGLKRSNSQLDIHRWQPSEQCSMRETSFLPLRQLSLLLPRPPAKVRMSGGIYTGPHTVLVETSLSA